MTGTRVKFGQRDYVRRSCGGGPLNWAFCEEGPGPYGIHQMTGKRCHDRFVAKNHESVSGRDIGVQGVSQGAHRVLSRGGELGSRKVRITPFVSAALQGATVRS